MTENRVQQKLLLNAFRSFHRSIKFRESKTSETISTASKDAEKKGQVGLPGLPGSSSLSPSKYTPKPLDKWLLVWMKKYKSVNDVPAQIRQETMKQVHSKSRIRIANILMVLILIGCVWAVWSGKKGVADGYSIQQKILEQHQADRDKYLANLEKQPKST